MKYQTLAYDIPPVCDTAGDSQAHPLVKSALCALYLGLNNEGASLFIEHIQKHDYEWLVTEFEIAGYDEDILCRLLSRAFLFGKEHRPAHYNSRRAHTVALLDELLTTLSHGPVTESATHDTHLVMALHKAISAEAPASHSDIPRIANIEAELNHFGIGITPKLLQALMRASA
tara:strand:+ start:89 stop:607 length:519 start_codon:yes stop_codon:yes gene_type:complete